MKSGSGSIQLDTEELSNGREGQIFKPTGLNLLPSQSNRIDPWRVNGEHPRQHSIRRNIFALENLSNNGANEPHSSLHVMSDNETILKKLEKSLTYIVFRRTWGPFPVRVPGPYEKLGYPFVRARGK